MPGLDVADAFDPEMWDTFILHRRVEATNNFGRPVLTDTVTQGNLGVVAAATPSDLQRWPEADISLRAIVVVTQVRLQLAAPAPVPPNPAGSQYKADVIEWAGNFYQVAFLDNYSRYGEGYLYAIAQMTDFLPAADTPNPVP